jgi:hypothetical protein
MATFNQLKATILTPAVVKLITEPLPPNLPPPPPGLGYEVIPTLSGGAVRTGNLIPTGRTELSTFDIIRNVATVAAIPIGGEAALLGFAASTAGPDLRAALRPTISKLKGGLQSWVSGTTSQVGFQDFLARLVRLRQINLGSLTSAVSRQIYSQVPLPPMIARLIALRR